MPPRVRIVSQWHETKGGGWTMSLRAGAYTVRLFEKRKGRGFYREVRGPRIGRDKKALDTTSRMEAERLGKEIANGLAADSFSVPHHSVAEHDLTLAELWAAYSASESFAQNKEKTRREDAGKAARLLAYFGAELRVASLSDEDQRRFSRERTLGGLRYTTGEREEGGELKLHVTKPCRPRTPQSELVLLHTMLNWATKRLRGGSAPLLAENPLKNTSIPAERNPTRPVATEERFVATITAMKHLASGAVEGSSEWRRWKKLELCLVLAEGTGRRLGAIRQLYWEDVSFSAGEITWRADADKKGIKWAVCSSPVVMGQLQLAQNEWGTRVGPVFCADTDPTRAMDRHLFDKWLRKAEEVAGCAKLKGGLWHPYRRKWAMERKHLPLSDVAATGGWKDIETLLNCYSQADRDTMLKVSCEPNKLRDAQVNAEWRSRLAG